VRVAAQIKKRLAGLVLRFANGNQGDFNKWMKEFDDNSIRALGTLVEMTAAPNWEEFVTRSFSFVLQQKLRIWYESSPDLEDIRSKKIIAKQVVSTSYKPIAGGRIREYEAILHTSEISVLDEAHILQFISSQKEVADIVQLTLKETGLLDASTFMLASIAELKSQAASKLHESFLKSRNAILLGVSGCGKTYALMRKLYLVVT
jgi:hypothetical protein